MQAILRAFSHFFLTGDKELHMAGQNLDRKIASHPLLAVEIPYDVLLRRDRKVRSRKTEDIFPLSLGKHHGGDGAVRAHTLPEPGTADLTDERQLDLPVAHTPRGIGTEPRDRTPVHRKQQHAVAFRDQSAAVHPDRKDAQFHLVEQHFDGIGENAEFSLERGARRVRRVRESARRGDIHGIPFPVEPHDVQRFAPSLQNDVERPADIARDAERTGGIVGRSAGDIAELHAALADPLQNEVERPVPARKDDGVILVRAFTGARLHVLGALCRSDIHLRVPLREPRRNIGKFFFDPAFSAVRIIEKQALHETRLRLRRMSPSCSAASVTKE